MQKAKFDIQGMTCSSCSSHVEKAVKKLEGVQKVGVNLLSNNMIVEYNENIINNDKIIKAVVDAGYEAKISNDKENNKKQNKREKVIDNNSTVKNMKKRLIISICF
ncbi:MAG: heavy-metal-associated domain-containing protein, partial [Bacilli bacterium]|nr:heavy-metal-associated domain-containing protein [Bacilli bacterium]